METDELGRRLRARRTAAGRTIASVAMQAGLSVPYIANLENGRGNPTLAALTSLARALGAELRVELAEARGSGEPVLVTVLPDSLVQFARLPRFAGEAERLASTTGQPVVTARERLLAAMSCVASVSPGPLTALDWHRVLDVIVLITRG